MYFAIRTVGDAIDVGIWEPADVSQQLERQVIWRLYLMGEVRVDRRFHQEITARDGVVVRHVRARSDGERSIETRVAVRISPGANTQIDTQFRSYTRKLPHDSEAIRAIQAHRGSGHKLAIHAVVRHSGRAGISVSCLVIDNDPYRSGIAGIPGFQGEAASAAFYQRDVAGYGSGVREWRAPIGRGRSSGISRVNGRDYRCLNTGTAQWRAKSSATELIDLGNRGGRENPNFRAAETKD